MPKTKNRKTEPRNSYKSIESVKRGIKQIGEGKVKSRGSFAKYVDER